MHYIAALSCFLGFVLQIAVCRAPEVEDSRSTVTNARRITIAALAVGAIYCGTTPPAPASLILGLLGLGQALYALHNLDLDILHHGPNT